MVIKSPFKDYYDFVAHQYGGGDPRVVYARGRITPKIDMYVDPIEGSFLKDPNWYCKVPWYYGRRPENEPEFDYMYLVITGKLYVLAKQLPKLPAYTGKTEYDLSPYRVQPTDAEFGHTQRWLHYHQRIEFGHEYKFLANLCRKVGAPVFVIPRIENDGTILVCGQCPILQRIGVPSLISPQQMYQDLAMFMGNRMKDTPDVQPPVELNNRQKIVKAGFDLIQSFRNRV